MLELTMASFSQTFVDPCSDAGFKAIFCDPANKGLLIDFLNMVLPSDRRIADLRYETTEIPGVTLYNKAARLDLRCRDTLGRNFIVEVQNYWQEHFFRRCAYYAARIYSYGVEKGDGQRYDVEPVFLVALLNASMGLDRKDSCWDGRYLSSYTFRELYTGQVEDDTIFITFVELYRFRRQRFEDCADVFEQLCWSLKNMQNTCSAPKGTLDLRLLDLWRAGEIAAFPEGKRAQYDTDMITERDHENMMYSAEMKGRREGMAEGKAEVARAMLAAGMPVEQIVALTGLTEEQVKGLR
jgi:hypothetical protein